MDEEISVPIEIPLDLDGFLRRECPTCEEQFNLDPPAGIRGGC